MSLNRRNNSKPTAVPKMGDPDRKRVLNILAQRRYRKRRSEKLASLVSQTKGSPTNSSTSPSATSGIQSPSSSTSEEPDVLNRRDSTDATNSTASYPVLEMDELGFLSTSEMSLLDTVGTASNLMTSNINGPIESTSYTLDPTFFLPQTNFEHLSTPATMQFTSFPLANNTDLEFPSMKAMRAGMILAQLMGIDKIIFDPTYSHVMQPLTNVEIPACMQPTQVQMTIPHHPLLDLYPWPSVRNKLICNLALPVEFRPPTARDSMAILMLFSDTDDTHEGLRVSGGGLSLDEESWEVGQQLFNNWWWAFEPRIIKQSNRLRMQRGAARLLLPSPTYQGDE